MNNANELIPTRQSLLSRLKDWNDQESWKVFFDTYWKLIYNAAIKTGLTDSEAQDVVQETVISVLKSMETFDYQAETGSFKRWLLRVTSWRIQDHLRQRDPHMEPLNPQSATHTRTATAERVPDLATMDLAPFGTKEWQTSYKNFAPRLGLAYQVSQVPGRETVLRGGFGVFYDTGNDFSAQNFTRS